MEADERLRRLQGARLASCRKAAGYTSARSAALDNGWTESTYRAHESGTRTIGQDDAEKYAKRFRQRGAKGATGKHILYGDDAAEISAMASIPAEHTRLAILLLARILPGMTDSGAQEIADLLTEALLDFSQRQAGLDTAELRGALDYIIRRSSRKPDA